MKFEKGTSQFQVAQSLLLQESEEKLKSIQDSDLKKDEKELELLKCGHSIAILKEQIRTNKVLTPFEVSVIISKISLEEAEQVKEPEEEIKDYEATFEDMTKKAKKK